MNMPVKMSQPDGGIRTPQVPAKMRSMKPEAMQNTSITGWCLRLTEYAQLMAR